MSALLIAHSNEILFAVATIVGLVSHYIKKRLKNETAVPIHEWFGSSNWPGSLTSIGTTIAIIVTALANGVIVEGMTFWSVIYTGFLTGYAIDSSTNTDQASVDRSMVIKEEKLNN